MGRSHASLAVATALALIGLCGEAEAAGGSTSSASGAGGSGGANCGCGSTTHTWTNTSTPSVTVNFPNFSFGAAEATASSTASASVSANVNATATSTSNTQALINEVTTGGGPGWSESGGVTTTIDTIKVEQPVETRRICAAFRSEMKMVALQASCLDDKEIPHPASQLSPDRDIAQSYEGELYRCIAGSRMQYTLADYSAQASFDHGQTLTCQKGEALYHTAAGLLQCRAQKPARDCNERSLLRRFGAGIKVIKMSRQGECISWRTETVQAEVTP